MGIKNANKPDITFVTKNGLTVKLVFDKEYRAFKKIGGGWLPMFLGGSDAEPLKEYIMKNF